MNQHYTPEDADHGVVESRTVGAVPHAGLNLRRWLTGIGAGVFRSLSVFWRWRQRGLGLGTLKNLSDHQLRDIGIDRSRIAAMVEEVVRTGRRSDRSGS